MDYGENRESSSGFKIILTVLVIAGTAVGIVAGVLPPIVIIILFIVLSIIRNPQREISRKKIEKKDTDKGWGFDFEKETEYTLPKTTPDEKDKNYSFPKEDSIEYGFPDEEANSLFSDKDDY